MKKESEISAETPQQSLEKILKTEILVAQQITQAKDKAELHIKSARDEVDGIKEKILSEARAEREQMLANGIEEAEKRARQDLENSKNKSEEFFISGQEFLETAVSNVIDVVLKGEVGSK